MMGREVERNVIGVVGQLVVMAIQGPQHLRRFRPQHRECW